MNMEQLTKQQIVLVTLLVSFVTSIATGIVTVALMDQAPPGVTQTINRIVEKTIEKVVTPPENTNSAAVVTTKETIVVSEDDKIAEAVAKNKNSVVRIYTNTDNAGDVAERMFIGLGTVVSKDGLIVTGDVFADQSGEYLATFDNTTFYGVEVLKKKEGNKFYFLKIIPNKKNPLSFESVIYGDSDNLKLGQTVIALSGQKQNAIFTGIVSSLGEAEQNNTNASSTSAKSIIAINTSINPADSLSGGPLLNLNGEVIGIRVSQNIFTEFSFLPSSILKNEVAEYASIQ